MTLQVLGQIQIYIDQIQTLKFPNKHKSMHFK